MFTKRKSLSFTLSLCLLVSFSFANKKELPVRSSPATAKGMALRVPAVVKSILATPLKEDFEGASKTTYTAADVQLGSGIWFFNNALIGTLGNDHKEGAKSARIRNTGSIRMNFDHGGGAGAVTVKYAVFGSDGPSNWELQVSSDGGNSFSRVGSAVVNATSTLQTATFAVNISGNIRIAIVKTDGGSNRINIDDVEIAPFTAGGGGTTGPDDDNMLMGNPSHAMADTNNFANYLMVKPWYTLSYNRDQGKPNWVSWHLHVSDLDSTDRSNDFRADSTLPPNWYHVNENSYKFSVNGFDRGHNCPSADRTASREINSGTFLMTNMMPQAPNNNQQTWGNLESYERALVNQGNEVYIIAGSYGKGGTGKSGTKTTLDNGHITVPSNTWKVIVVLPDGSNDLSRVTTSTRVIAVIMPNINTIDKDWKKFRVSVRAIELATGYDLLSNVSPAIQQVIETKVDNE
ncbi:MAG TPA: DNA/RNA non-specific endonuclease [Puia sp.]|nr:DNA/RNA non-specific endonuclease [Puia sp.]